MNQERDWKDLRVRACCCNLLSAVVTITMCVLVVDNAAQLRKYEHFDPILTTEVVEDW